MSAIHQDMLKSPLDDSLLSLGENELAFFQAHTGIEDIEEVRRHILKIQAEAYEIHPYPCIRRFTFTKLNITKLPCYEHVLALGKSQDRAIFLDVGCCFGHDIRALVADGYPVQNIIGLDLKRDLWDLGLQLFKSTPTTFPVSFIEGDIFDDVILNISLPAPVPPPIPSLPHLGNSLTAFRSRVFSIHVGMVFHLFPEEKQLELARRLWALLSPVPGSIIFGGHVGLPVPGIHPNNTSGIRMFCHSPDSWRALWDSVSSEEGSIEVDAKLVPMEASEPPANKIPALWYGRDTNERWNALEMLVWSVKRV